jgi:ABC-2 type transport system permease protein
MPLAFFASAGRGYLLPIGVAIMLVVFANLLTVLGWAPYFPWAVPGLYAQAKGYLAPASCPLALLTGLAGMLATYVWWNYADQSR